MNIPKVIAVWSPKAGAGKSFITANLAYEFNKNNILTAVLDFDTVCPSQEHFLNMTVNDANNIELAMSDREDMPFDAFQQHDTMKNVFVLTNGKTTPIDACYKINYKSFETLIDKVKSRFETVIIDCPSDFSNAATAAALLASEKIVTVLKQDLLDVYAFVRYAPFLEKLDIVKWKHVFVLNFAGNSVLGKDDILKLLKVNSLVEISRYKDLNLCNNSILEDITIRSQFQRLFDTVTVNNYLTSLNQKNKKTFSFPLFKPKKKHENADIKLKISDNLPNKSSAESDKKLSTELVIAEVKENKNIAQDKQLSPVFQKLKKSKSNILED